MSVANEKPDTFGKENKIMNSELLKKHIKSYLSYAKSEPAKFKKDMKERADLIAYYKSYTHDKIVRMTEDEIYEYLYRLWAMLIWGNKHYVVDKIIEDNGLDNFRKRLAELIWDNGNIEKRWDNFRSNIKGMGPAMISEILCKTHPDDFMLWNRRAYVGLDYLNAENLPRYDYQLTGKVYENLCNVCKKISTELKKSGFEDNNLLAVDYFIWEELQVEDNLSKIYIKDTKTARAVEPDITETTEFVHDDIKDKLRDIGQWLGFTASIERKVSEGSKVDTIWESTIGNMGRVIYVFEVQTKGSIDSLILNLLKSLNNPAVQGIVAVSDSKQLDKIKKHAADVRELRDKLKFWDYEEVSRIHESLEFVNASINNLGLVPEGF